MPNIGETRESDHIDFRHWTGIRLRARRHGDSQWLIEHIDGSQSSVVGPAIEVASWQPGYGDIYVYWNGNNFSFIYSTGVPLQGGPFHEIPYFAADPTPENQEWWKCSWEPDKNLFLHTFMHGGAG